MKIFPLWIFAPKDRTWRFSAWCQQIELLQHVIYSKHVNWLKLWNFHLSQILFSRIQQQDIPQVQITDLRSKSKKDKNWYTETSGATTVN